MLQRRKPAPEQRADRSAEFASVVIERPRARMAAGLANEHPVVIEKPDRYYSEAWRRAVASLPCVLCGKEGDTQCAHRNEGKAGGKKLMDDCWTAALCTACHREIDQGKQWSRETKRETMIHAILLTVLALARRGLVKPT